MKIVILGGVAAGAKAAAKTRRLLPDASIELFTDDTHVSYSACGLPYYIQGNFKSYETLLVRTPEEFEAQGIHIHLQNRAIKIIPESNQVIIQDLITNRAFVVDYDKLVIATGARPVLPSIKNIELQNVFTLRNIEDGIAIREKALQSKHATIIGSGYIGLELLEAFVKLGLHVNVIELSSSIAPIFDDDMSEIIYQQLMSISDGRFELLNSEVITEFISDEHGAVKGVMTGNGKKFDTDMVVVAAGVRPNIEFAREAGVAIGETGAIKVNKHMHTNLPHIYACGDCAEKTLLITGSKVWVPLGSTANKEGRTAAINLSGGHDDFDGILGSSVVRCLSLTMAMTGLTVKKAKQLGFNPIFATVTKFDKVGYMPEVNNITLKLIADKNTGLLLGGQAVGAGDADKRINALTAALVGKLTIEEFARNDLTYAPPFSPTIDPLLNAAEILLKKYQSDN